ncbi:MAG: hypothetical protein PQJ46_06385 [Spirochaetales bacterium]|nr:hypothetical protein [Spirochaetales bacterium]
MKKKILFSFILFFLIFSCGSTEVVAPSNIEASDPDEDNPNRVEISWSPVDGAGIYYVYRSESESGTFENVGFSVTSDEDSDGDTRYYFVENFEEGEGGTYYYCVTAAPDKDISSESARSSVVAASTYSGSWTEPKEIGSASILKLAAGSSDLYAVYCSSDTSSDLGIYKYAEDEDSEEDDAEKVWTSIDSPGSTNGSLDNPFSVLVIDSELYVVYNDQASTAGGKLTSKYYHDSSDDEDNPSFAWTAYGSEAFNDVAANGIDAVESGLANDIYTIFFESSTVTFYKNSGSSGSWFEIDITSESFINNAGSLRVISNNNTPYIGYEDTTDGGLYLRAYEDSSLQADGNVSTSGIDDGNVAFVSGTSAIYAVYFTDSGSFEAKSYEDSVWSALTNTDGQPTVKTGTSGSLDSAWYNGYLYVFYLGSDGAYVKYYDNDDGWQSAQKNGGVITSASAGSLQLVASDALYAGYIESGKAYVRILE